MTDWTIILRSLSSRLFSTATTVPDTGARLFRTAAIFSGLLVFGFAIGFLVHRSIVRGRRLLDDESIVA